MTIRRTVRQEPDIDGPAGRSRYVRRVPELSSSLAELVTDSPPVTEAHDTSVPAFGAYVDRVEAELSTASAGPAAAIADRVQRSAPDAIGLLLALKIAESRAVIRSLTEPIAITLLNPVYKETGRMLPRDQHPHGEDSIRYKAAALDHISALNPGISTRLVVIDDGCPDGSGEVAARIMAGVPGWEDRHDVLFLEAALEEGDPCVPPGLTTKDGERRSVKGGAVLYGMRRALRLDPGCQHVIVDNDADLSVLPDQLGLLLDGVVNDGLGVVAGSRREPDSVALIGEARNSRGTLFIRIWQHLLPGLAARVVDTNRAFKAFDAVALARIIDDVQIYTFPYQIEILQSAISRGVPLAPRGIAYIDSEAASTQHGESITETYLDQIRQIIDIAERFGTVEPDDPLLAFLTDVDDRAWRQIERDPPRELLDILGADPDPR